MLSYVTPGGRPAFVINVEVYLHRNDRWLLIKRSELEAHAPGVLAGVGGKVEVSGSANVPDILEERPLGARSLRRSAWT